MRNFRLFWAHSSVVLLVIRVSGLGYVVAFRQFLAPLRPFLFQGLLLTYEMVTGERPAEDEESPPVDETTLQNAVVKEAFFVDFLRTDEHDEDGVSARTAFFLVYFRIELVVMHVNNPRLCTSRFCTSRFERIDFVRAVYFCFTPAGELMHCIRWETVAVVCLLSWTNMFLFMVVVQDRHHRVLSDLISKVSLFIPLAAATTRWPTEAT